MKARLRSFPFISALAAGLSLLSVSLVSAQQDVCGAGTPTLAVNTTCVTTAYNVSSGFGNEIAAPSCVGTSYRDGWYTFTTNATTTFITITCTTDRNVGIAVYTGSCGALTEAGCRNSAGGSGTEILNMTVSPSTTYYLRIMRVNNANANNMVGNVCITTPTKITTCSATFTDTGGPGGSATTTGAAGNYANNQNYTVVYCPSTAGQCIQAAFTAFNVESGFDYLYVYNGDSPLAPQLTGSPYTGGTSPGTLLGTTTNTTGCLTFIFTSDNIENRLGWSANITCAACAVPPPAVVQDCNGGTTVCNDAAFVGNSSGSGNVADLTSTNDGCLSGENQSSWYYFSPSASGTVALNITPSTITDDYDFAIWGPGTITCPPTSTPIRCSWAAVSGNTGLNASAAGQNTEGALGDGFVDVLTVTAGQQYILVVDNYTGSSSPFTLDWTMSGGATLNCTPLPVELLGFQGIQAGKKIELKWNTMAEINNDYFTIEHSADGIDFTKIAEADGAGTSTQQQNYTIYDENPAAGINYYRLKQTDFNGTHRYSSVIAVPFVASDVLLNNVHPNPTADAIGFDLYAPASGKARVRIMDYTGRVVMDELFTVNEGRTEIQTRIAALAGGLYSMKVEVPQLGFSNVVKIIKQ